MVTKISSILTLLLYAFSFAQQSQTYQSLDSQNPIVFGGDHILYQGKKIVLGQKALFIDAQFTGEEAAKYPYVFNSVNEAVKNLTDGTEDSPMTLYLAPNVYWIDNPDDPAIRTPEEGSSTPYGLQVKCEWLKFQGLSDKPENVVITANRGQTIGAIGNFTMFKFSGQGTSSENITFGNYCNVDLEYPLKPELNRKKRASAIVQAQLIHCDGDKIVARNTRFISRLNLCPFVGGKRVLFDNCHFESTDDALCGTGIYLNCTLDFYSSKPFYWTKGTGAVFLNCNIRSFTRGKQFFTKANGQLALVDTRISSESLDYIGWNDTPPLETRNYQFNVQLNNKPVFIGHNDSASTVDMTNKSLLDAYLFKYKEKTIYNTYNLLSGNDDWDPMQIREIVMAAENDHHKKYHHLPTQLTISPTRITIETNKDQAVLKAKINRFGNYDFEGEEIKWRIDPQYSSVVDLLINEKENSCTVVPKNTSNETIQLIVTARTLSGLEGVSVLNVAPSKLEPPSFSNYPKLIKNKQGELLLKYQLDSNLMDQSEISWYRCTDVDGSNPIEVAVSRQNEPFTKYQLTLADDGYYIKAAITPKHIRSEGGRTIQVITPKPIRVKEIKQTFESIATDFKNVSLKNQPEIKPGFWTFRPFENLDNTTTSEGDSWYFGLGQDGAANMNGLLQRGRSASMYYTPINQNKKNLKLNMTLSPFKTAGQGFSVAHMYMDILIKYDPMSMTGYGLRIIRTTKYHDAVDCYLVEYKNGTISIISEVNTTSSFRSPCFISLEIMGNKFVANLKTAAVNYKSSDPEKIKSEVLLKTKINANNIGGFGIRYNGGSATMVNKLKAEWQ